MWAAIEAARWLPTRGQSRVRRDDAGMRIWALQSTGLPTHS